MELNTKCTFEKALRNSFYEIYVPKFFYWNSVEKAEEITKIARKALYKMIKQYYEA